MNFYVYILQCADHTFYTGYTNDVLKRLNTHNSGKGAKYTRSRRPCKLVWACAYDTKSDAMKREYEIKQLTRQEKMKLIEDSSSNWPTPAKAKGDILSPLAEKYLKKYPENGN
jgi:predicted GIY-YIG superfamily endonuclease